MPADGKIWGTRYPRPTAVARVTGTLDYGADLGLRLPKDALYLALAQAEVSHAEILSIDTSEAEKMPGVFKVLTHKDVKGNNRIVASQHPHNKGDGWIGPSFATRRFFSTATPSRSSAPTPRHTRGQRRKR